MYGAAICHLTQRARERKKEYLQIAKSNHNRGITVSDDPIEMAPRLGNAYLDVKTLDSHARRCGFKSCLARDKDYWWRKVTGAHLHKCAHSPGHCPLWLGWQEHSLVQFRSLCTAHCTKIQLCNPNCCYLLRLVHEYNFICAN